MELSSAALDDAYGKKYFVFSKLANEDKATALKEESLLFCLDILRINSTKPNARLSGNALFVPTGVLTTN